MLIVDPRYAANVLAAPVKTISAKLTEVTDEGVPVEIMSSDYLMSANAENIGTFLGTAGKKLTCQLLNHPYEMWTGLFGKTFNYSVGVVDPASGDTDWCSEGVYVVKEVDVNLDTGNTKITMYDQIVIAGELLYSDNILTFPCTVAELAQQVADKLTLILEDITPYGAFLPNADYEITEDLYRNLSGFTLRQVIEEIAKATGTTAIVSDGKLVFKQWTSPVLTLTAANMIKFKLGGKWGVANSLVLSRMPQNDNINLTNESSVDENGLTEIKIINNEILDDDREALIVPLYDALIAPNDIAMNEIQITTEGHGWYEIGDIVAVSIDGEEYPMLITEIKLDVAGSFRETIKCVLPDATETDYLSSGGVMKTVFNTELKVDKQNQEITSVVSQLESLDETVASNYSEIKQDINGISATVQGAVGNNLIKNSVGYTSNSNDELPPWEYTGAGDYTSDYSSESLPFGAISGSQITLTGEGLLTQRVLVERDATYSLGFRAKKAASGKVIIWLLGEDYVPEGTGWHKIELEDGVGYNWEELRLSGIVANSGYFDVVIDTREHVGDFAITDLRLVNGNSLLQWSQANGEMSNMQVSVSVDGVKVKSSVYEGDFTQITPIEFAGYSSVSGSEEKVFYLNRDTTYTKKLLADDQITMPPIKIVPIASGDRAGWSFVRLS